MLSPKAIWIVEREKEEIEQSDKDLVKEVIVRGRMGRRRPGWVAKTGTECKALYAESKDGRGPLEFQTALPAGSLAVTSSRLGSPNSNRP